MSSKEEQEIKQCLLTCTNMAEIFNFLTNYFDLSSKKIPLVFKPTIVSGIISAIKWIDPLKK